VRLPVVGGVIRRLTLQGRFALLAALAVTVVVLAAAAVSYFLVSGQLNEEVNSELSLPRAMSSSAHANPVDHDAVDLSTSASDLTQTFAQCKSRHLYPGEGRIPVVGAVVISTSSGSTCSLDPYQYSLGATAVPQQLAAANGTVNSIVYDTYTTSGVHVRVRSEHLGAAGSGFAISSIVSLAHRDSALHSLAIALVFAALGGILLAAAAGFLVARSALKPVRRLTRAVEHVALTDNLSIRLPVDGPDELSRLATAFNRMTKSLAGSRERQQRLIADAGHELRTPLTSVRTNIDVLLRSKRSGRALPLVGEEEVLETVDQELHELSGLVTDLLELSRNAEGGMRRTMRVPLHESVGRAVERARLRGPGLEFDVEIEPWFVNGEPTGLDRAVVNLLDNAVKFSPAGGRVTVRLSKGEYTVRDQGPGIDPADLPRVFERFYRSDSARQLPGSGLGLAIVAQIAEETGGKIILEPAVGGGTLARLILPGDPGTPAELVPPRQ